MNKTPEEEIKTRLDKELERWFPKGTRNSRGAAMTFYGACMLEMRKLIDEIRRLEHIIKSKP